MILASYLPRYAKPLNSLADKPGPKRYVGRTAPLACGAATSDQSHRSIGPSHSVHILLDRQLGKPHVPHHGGSPTAREGDGPGGKRCRRKRRPPCNGADRAARAGIPDPKGCRLPTGPASGTFDDLLTLGEVRRWNSFH